MTYGGKFIPYCENLTKGLSAHNNNCKKQLAEKRKKKEKKTQQHRYGLMLVFADLMPDC
jgi:hypothetical protein